MEKHRETLEETFSHIIDESRMVLPGIQTLFGFQLIAFFQEGFSSRLSPLSQQLHLAATALVVVGLALLMAPAAYHRQAEPRSISERMIVMSTRLLTVAMLPLAVAIGVEFYVICDLQTHHHGFSIALSVALTMLCVALWYIWPRLGRS